MKTTLLLATLMAFTTLAPAADKDDAKKERKDRNERKDDKKEKKEEMMNQFEVTVEGAKDTTAESDVKTYLSSIEGVKVEKCEKTDKGIEAVLSTKAKLSRSDISKALKDNKELKVSEFKAVRPGRDKKDDKAEDKKDDKKGS